MAIKNYEVECRRCHFKKVFQLDEADVKRWQVDRELIQRVFPTMTPGDRELLISRTCETCFDDLFGDDDD